MTKEEKTCFILDMPKTERPREKLEKYGAALLSDEELMAILIRNGTASKSALELGASLLREQGGLLGLARAELSDFMKVKGVGLAKACQIMAALELGKRVMRKNAEERISLDSPETVYEFILPDVKFLKQEVFYALLLDIRCGLIAKVEISRGALGKTSVDPKMIYEAALRKNASSVVLVHNHPSGDPSPSEPDISFTEHLVKGARLLGLRIVDHVIIGEGKFFSLKRKKLMNFDE